MDDTWEGPRDLVRVKRLLLEILSDGSVRYSRHAKEEMLADGMTILDCISVLRGGIVRPPDFEGGSWRYRVETASMTVVVAIRSRNELVIVTAWRAKK